MANNYLYIPELNPVTFFEVGRANIDKYFTKHFETFMFHERLNFWQRKEKNIRVWNTTDIINLQFESTFDPIIVDLLNEYGAPVITLPALIGLPNEFLANTWSFEVSMSLANLPSGCYRQRITAGTGGDQKIYISECMLISSEKPKDTIIMEYWNSRAHSDVIFETGIKFQFRMPGWFGSLDPARNDDKARDQKNNPTLLNSRYSKQWPVTFGDQFGVSDDIVNLLQQIWSCDNVLIDGKPFCIAGNFEYIPIDRSAKRFVKLLVEEGINRNSRVFAVNVNTAKKIMSTVIVEAKVFGDTSNQGSANTVPVLNVE